VAANIFTVSADQAGQTLATLLRQWLPGQSWSQVRRLVEGRRVRLNGELWLDAVRRLKADDKVEVLPQPLPRPHEPADIVIRHLDDHLVVVEKPAGIATVRHPAERDWLAERRLQVPTLDDLVLRQLGERLPRKKHEPRPRLRIVHRLDKGTSGLIVFARTVEAERGLGRQFAHHDVVRRYLAIVPGHVQAQTIATHLVRDRGDGRRGSTALSGVGKEAVTHIEVLECLSTHTVVTCRLETGRTHQIRIHLAELGHPVCGETVYNRQEDAALEGPPRLALHASELGFVHPVTGQKIGWTMPLPRDLDSFLQRLRAAAPVQSLEKAPSVQIKWTDTDPETGQRRFLCAERFARVWSFRWKLQRRGDWTRGLEPTRTMWEHVLDSLKRRYRRREGVSDEDVEQVERILAEIRRHEEEEE
jgi:23S rRNA pseudouridine1911/1915/1917 synthase